MSARRRTAKWGGNAPAWYRRMLNRLYRARANAAVRRGLDPPRPVKHADDYW